MIRYTAVYSFKVDGITYSAIKVEKVADRGDHGREDQDCLCYNMRNDEKVSAMIPVVVVKVDTAYFQGKVVVPDTFTYKERDFVVVLIRPDFCRPEELIEFKMPRYISVLFTGTFMECVNLKFVSLSPLLRYIEMSAFSGCVEMEYVMITPRVSHIEDNAFEGCTGLKYLFILTFPDSPKCVVEENAFVGCTAIERIGLLARDPKVDKPGLPDDFTYPGFHTGRPGVQLWEHVNLLFAVGRQKSTGVDELRYYGYEVKI